MFSKSVRIFLVIVITLISTLVVPSQVSAAVNCNFPGIVENRSSKPIKIRFDNNAGQIIIATLNPGQNSSSIFCDVDQFSVSVGSFQVYQTVYTANYYYPNGAGNGSIGYSVWRCWNGGAGTSGVRCAKFI